MGAWDEWSAEDWVRHYAPQPVHASGESFVDQASRVARNLAERGQHGLENVSTQLHGVLDAPGRLVSAVELEAERLAERARAALDHEQAKLEKTVKWVALGAVAVVGLMALEGKK